MHLSTRCLLVSLVAATILALPVAGTSAQTASQAPYVPEALARQDGQRGFDRNGDTNWIGEFKGDRGEFIDQESFGSRTILVRFVITKKSRTACEFEQAYSDDGGKSWELNWVAEDTLTPGQRADDLKAGALLAPLGSDEPDVGRAEGR
jgi:hypothetical protein